MPAPEGRVWGEVYEMADPELVLAALDDIEGYRADDPDRSLYVPNRADVTMPDGHLERAWVDLRTTRRSAAPSGSRRGTISST